MQGKDFKPVPRILYSLMTSQSTSKARIDWNIPLITTAFQKLLHVVYVVSDFIKDKFEILEDFSSSSL